MPFKTKVVPDWKIQKEGKWGKSYPKAEYLNREKQEVKVFDLKGYVDAKREDKISQLTQDFNKNRMSGIPDFPPMPSKKNEMPKDSFNIDELIKRIDSKIAELEKEEEEENKKKLNQVKVDEKQEDNLSNLFEKIEDKKVEEVKETVPNDNSITDDQFFDDFFYDED